MNLLINIFPVILLAAALIYALKLPVERIYTFENSARLWFIHTILVTAMPLFFFKLISDVGLKLYIGKFLEVRSNYGLLIGLSYIIPWLLYFFSPFTPILAACVFYFLSDKIIIKYERLISDRSDDKILIPYRDQLSFLQNEIPNIFRMNGVPCNPKLYVRQGIKHGCYVLGTSKRNISIVVTTGLLHSLREGKLTGDEIEAMVCHEIGHVLNGDIRLASSIKIFSDLRIIQVAVLSTFAGILLVYLTGIGFTFFYTPHRLSDDIKFLKGFVLYISLFFTWYIIFFLIDLLIRTTFKTREFYADAQALRIFKKQDIFIRTLNNAPLPLGFLGQRSLALGIFPEAISASLAPAAMKVLCNALKSLTPQAIHNKIIEKLDRLTERLKSILLTHPTPDQRIHAILNRTYFPTHPVLTSSKTYLIVGITLFLSFLFFVAIALILSPSGWTFLIYIFCTLAALVVITNAHLKVLGNEDLPLLFESYFVCGFRITSERFKKSGRKLFFANHIAFLPFTVFWYVAALPGACKDKDFPVWAVIGLLVMPFLIVEILTFFIFAFLSRFKKDISAKSV